MVADQTLQLGSHGSIMDRTHQPLLYGLRKYIDQPKFCSSEDGNKVLLFPAIQYCYSWRVEHNQEASSLNKIE